MSWDSKLHPQVREYYNSHISKVKFFSGDFTMQSFFHSSNIAYIPKAFSGDLKEVFDNNRIFSSDRILYKYEINGQKYIGKDSFNGLRAISHILSPARKNGNPEGLDKILAIPENRQKVIYFEYQPEWNPKWFISLVAKTNADNYENTISKIPAPDFNELCTAFCIIRGLKKGSEFLNAAEFLASYAEGAHYSKETKSLMKTMGAGKTSFKLGEDEKENQKEVEDRILNWLTKEKPKNNSSSVILDLKIGEKRLQEMYEQNLGKMILEQLGVKKGKKGATVSNRISTILSTEVNFTTVVDTIYYYINNAKVSWKEKNTKYKQIISQVDEIGKYYVWIALIEMTASTSRFERYWELRTQNPTGGTWRNLTLRDAVKGNFSKRIPDPYYGGKTFSQVIKFSDYSTYIKAWLYWKNLYRPYHNYDMAEHYGFGNQYGSFIV